jgi:hypothetical protein
VRKSQPRAIAKREERLEGSKHSALVQFDCSVVMARTENTWTFHGTYTEHMDVPWHIHRTHGRSMARAFIRRTINTAVRDGYQGSQCGICGGQNDTRTGFLRVLPFCPVSIIRPMLHTVIMRYRRCVM